ncbi:MAG: hypothetical protein A3F92_14905 [Candidatus Rokubacteria bacterium RIFCSPLOWO2_12_FULL_71_22]|nr:MAG: hypothetical protein A3F92_14905 [Candidatus Rokubacteria bacterium RIFCSPLOWO2_12_FULL_71_22]
MSRATVAGVVVDGLRRAGTSRIFGVPGAGAPLALLDAARAAALTVVLAYGESAACVMAAVTADLTDAPGVASVGASAGVVAAAAGVAHAVLDRSPLVLLTDRHPREVLGCKASVVVDGETAAVRTVDAIRAAMTAPRGPVHLDVPEHVAGRPAAPGTIAVRSEASPPLDPAALDEAARLLGRSSRPLLLLGQHCRAADAPWLRAFAEALPAPALVTAKAKGALPDPHPLVLGVVAGEFPDERALRRVDLIVALGLDAAEPAPRGWWSRVPVLLVGPTPRMEGEPTPSCRVLGTVALVLEELAPRLADRPRADWDVAELDRLKRDRLRAGPSPGLAPQRVVQLSREAMEAGTLAAVDPGAHWDAVTGAWQAVAPGEFLAPNGAAQGFALPAAIAAHLARPERRIVAFTDSAGLVAASAELETAKRLATPVVLVVFGGADAVRLAQGFGLAAYAADSEPAFAQALGRARRTAGPAVIGVFA